MPLMTVLMILCLLVLAGPVIYVGLRTECRQRQLRALKLTKETMVINLLLCPTRQLFYGACLLTLVRKLD